MLCRTGSARHSSAVTASNAPVPNEEAREDANTENISFHMYEYKTSLQKDGKEWRQLESSTAFIIGPPLDAGGTT